MNSQKRNTRNLNLKEENSSRFILGNYSGLSLKSSFNSVLPHLLSLFFFFFCRYQASSFFMTLSLPALLLAFVEKVHLPLLGDGVGVFIVGLWMFIISVGLLWQAGLWHQSCGVRLYWNLFENLSWTAKISLLDFLIQRFDGINSKVPEASMLTSGKVVQHMKVHAWLY